MAEKKTKKTKKKSLFKKGFFKNMDPELKSILIKCSGGLVMIVALFTFVSMFSYLFTWSADKDLLMNQRLPLRPGPTGQRKSSDSNVKNSKNINMHKNSIDSLLKFTVGIIAQQILIVNKARM